jgi:hypothetical protein
MKIKMKAIVAAVGIVASIACNSTYAISNINYNITKSNNQYKLLLDGQSYTIPDDITYSDGSVISLETFKSNLANKTTNTVKYDKDSGTITYNGGVSLTTVYDEYVPLISNVGIQEKNSNNSLIQDCFEKYQLLPKRISAKESYEKAIENTTDEEKLKEYNLRVSTYSEDIARMQKINIDPTSKKVISSIPYLGEKVSIQDDINITKETITTNIDVGYYIFSLIFRDLRLNSIEYSINSGTYKSVPDYNMNTYTYTIKLPESTPDNATISTKSTGYMDAILKYNNITGYDLNLEVKDDTITLVNGMGTIKVKNVFNMQDAFGEYIDGYSSNPERVYTINFTKYDYIKGDLDRNGVINANDAAIALDLYKYGNVSDEDLQIGDMDDNGVINGNDAALILDMYKYGY